MHGLFNDLGRA